MSSPANPFRRAWDDDEGLGRRPAAEGAGNLPDAQRIEVLRRIDPWSALKLSLFVYFSLFAVWLVVAIGLWALARRGGAIDGLEGFIEDMGFAREGSFRFKDGEILRMTAVVGPILVVVASLVTVAGVAIFNVASRLSGGLEATFRRR